MATTQRTGLPFVDVTWLPTLLAGELQCLYQPWLKSHFKYDKRPERTFNTAAWTQDHNQLVNQRAEVLRRAGWVVTLENQNAFRLHGQSAILAGKPDIIATRDKTMFIIDVKAGQQRNSDWWQVLIYMLVVPLVYPQDGIVRGEVLYRDHLILVEPESLTPARSDQVYALIRRLGTMDRPPTTPSQHDCAWCDIAECVDRFVETINPIETSAF